MLIPGVQTSVRIERLAAGEDAGAWRCAIGSVAAGGGELLKEDGAARVRATATAVFKVRRMGGLWDRLRAGLGIGKEERQWRGASLLARAGVATARPLAIARTGGERVLVLERLPGPTLLGVLAGGALTLGQERALAAELARVVAVMVAGRVFNRDAKASNWIVTSLGADRVGADRATLAAIDTAGVRSAGSDGGRMLGSVVIEALGVGCLPRRTVLLRGLRCYVECRRGERGKGGPLVKSLWRSIARSVAAHGDPRPQVNPLGGGRP